jgi:hypothetical protein
MVRDFGSRYEHSLLTAKSVLDAANCILDFSGHLFGFAFSFDFATSGEFTDGFFYRDLSLAALIP